LLFRIKGVMIKRLLGYLLNGVLIAIPIGVILYLIYKTFVFLDDLIPWDNKPPGAGLVILVVLLTGIGILSSSFIFKPINTWFIRLIDRVPLLKTIYSAIKDLLSAFVGKKKKFNQPVLVTMGNGLEKIGFITDEAVSHLDYPADKVAVYFPFSFGVMGSLFIVRKDMIVLLDKNVTDIMKYIVSAGVSENSSVSRDENEK